MDHLLVHKGTLKNLLIDSELCHKNFSWRVVVNKILDSYFWHCNTLWNILFSSVLLADFFCCQIYFLKLLLLILVTITVCFYCTVVSYLRWLVFWNADCFYHHKFNIESPVPLYFLNFQTPCFRKWISAPTYTSSRAFSCFFISSITIWLELSSVSSFHFLYLPLHHLYFPFHFSML